MNVTDKYSLDGQTGLSARDFTDHLVGLAVSRVNVGVSQTLTARRSVEHPPRDSRHLTDTRTRVSTLLEYSVAYEMNRILERESDGFSISAVLWNVFPDLIVRDPSRENVIGLEVKALHTAAEEKSANLDTPLSVIRKAHDFVVILVWGWTTGVVNGTPITYPHIHAHGVFDAWLLARIRDYGWLAKQGGRVKGIDLCTPVINSQQGGFKAEEGNLGKLMRIALPEVVPPTVAGYDEMIAENARYSAFSARALALGLRETFLDVCTVANAVNVNTTEAICYPSDPCELGHAVTRDGNSLALVAGARALRWLEGSEPPRFEDGSVCLWLSQKLDWIVYKKDNEGWSVRGSGQKPDSELETIALAINGANP